MAVYEHTYRPYEGDLTPAWSRFLIVPRHAFRNVFRSKFFVAFFVACFLPVLVAAIFIYLKHNANALAIFDTPVTDLIPIDAQFFLFFLKFQCWAGFFLTLLVGPPLVARDTANNALPLYLSRPFSRAEYVLGKMSVLLIMLSLITWAPLLLLFLLQSYLEGWRWFADNAWMAASIYFGCCVWMVLLALLSMAISAWVKWRIAASAALIAIFFIPSVLGGIINQLFRTRWASIISLSQMISHVWDSMFGLFVRESGQLVGFERGRPVEVTLIEPPLVVSWLVLVVAAGICLWMLSRKVRAYEVVK